MKNNDTFEKIKYDVAHKNINLMLLTLILFLTFFVLFSFGLIYENRTSTFVGVLFGGTFIISFHILRVRLQKELRQKIDELTEYNIGGILKKLDEIDIKEN